MHYNNVNTSSIMAELFGKIPSDDPRFFTIRRLDVKGRKVEVSSPPIESPINCFFYLNHGEAMISIGKDLYFFQPGECEHNPLHRYSTLRRWGYHKVAFNEAITEGVNGILRRLCIENDAAKNPNIIKAYLSAFLTEIEEASDNEKRANNDNATCNRFVESVFESYRLNRSLSDYAQQLNVSKEHLRKVVKRCTGKGPLEWINEARILESKSLLFNTDLTVNEIAPRVGVEDPAYFSRLFKKNTGMTPIQYRTVRKKSNTNTE